MSPRERPELDAWMDSSEAVLSGDAYRWTPDLPEDDPDQTTFYGRGPTWVQAEHTRPPAHRLAGRTCPRHGEELAHGQCRRCQRETGTSTEPAAPMTRPRRPRRVQLSRKAGWRLPDGAISVARPSRWGNPYRVGSYGLRYVGLISGEGAGFYSGKWADKRRADQEIPFAGLSPGQAVALYRQDLEQSLEEMPGDDRDDQRRRQDLQAGLAQLAGHDLACWCPLHGPCHADVLLDLANRENRRAR